MNICKIYHNWINLTRVPLDEANTGLSFFLSIKSYRVMALGQFEALVNKLRRTKPMK